MTLLRDLLDLRDRFVRRYGVILAAGAVATLLAIGVSRVGPTPAEEFQVFAVTSGPPVPAGDVAPSVVDPTALPAPAPVGSVTTRAVRVDPPTTTAPRPTPGDCLSWSAEFVARGATSEEVRFFFAGRVLERESGCGLDTLNDRTGDSGPCQISPVHNRPGWFGGREFGDGVRTLGSCCGHGREAPSVVLNADRDMPDIARRLLPGFTLYQWRLTDVTS